MSGACARCQRDGEWGTRAEIVNYGLNLCYPHDRELRSDLDALAKLDDSDPENAHSRVDDVLMKWAPKSIHAAVTDVMRRQRWWAFS